MRRRRHTDCMLTSQQRSRFDLELELLGNRYDTQKTESEFWVCNSVGIGEF